ncbi:hypothetical protein [Gaetbulibacter aestuarii]|uniref:Calcium-binding protein n=1 Tax=Gaetbulibacter aestuarii TaxID=1502358 RepID=A0ABW7MZB7_9FLAO
MRKFFFLLLPLLLLPSCDDGNVITVELNFGEDFQACESASDIVLYKTKTDPTESLSLLITKFSKADLIAVGTDGTLTTTKSATIYYRTYTDASLPNDLFCTDIPPNVHIVQDENDACSVDFSTILAEDDKDGIPAVLEDLNGDGNYENDDTDGDGLPNYIDMDDDGDNVLTANENPDPNGDGNLDDAQDTDGDGIPDYLDPDDDGDGVLTRDEENQSQDQNPENDITNNNVGADYLNPDVSTTVPATAYRQHTIYQTYTVSAQVRDISLSFLSQEILDFGILKDGITTNTRKVTPPFN